MHGLVLPTLVLWCLPGVWTITLPSGTVRIQGAEEGGADWDLAIAESTGIKAMSALTAGAPASQRAVVNIQGDFLHFDGLSAITPQHGHVLDADGR